jgi:transposase-like protein
MKGAVHRSEFRCAACQSSWTSSAKSPRKPPKRTHAYL